MKYPQDCVAELLGALRGSDDRSAKDDSLPGAETLEALLGVAFAASMEPEEGRFATFGLAFIPPDEERRIIRQLRFSEPLHFSTREVVKLAAATDSTKTSLAVWGEPPDAMRIWGLVTSESQSLESSPPGGHPTFLLHAPFPLVRARAPGVLYVYLWQQLQLLYVRGEAYFRPPGGRLQAILRDKAHLEPHDAQALSEIATSISLLGHGGTILLTDPNVDPPAGLLDIPYKFDPPSTMLRAAVRQKVSGAHDQRAKDIERHAREIVAQLSQIDGALHLSSDLTIRGFGAKIRASAEPPTLMAEEPEGHGAHELSLSAFPGTRHRSAVMFCAQHPGQALAIVISHDGDVSLFGRRPDGSVLRIGPFALGAGLAVGG